MATVHQAWDEQCGRAVAIKLYVASADRVTQVRFRDEARTLAGLSHPRLVMVYDAGTDLDQMFLVLQLVSGQSLRERLANRPMRPKRVRILGAELAEALAYVHGQGVVHRDIKPANILLDGQSRPYLADFGISRLVDGTRVTATGHLVGTPAYLAPEQVLGANADAAIDVYALGLVLLECLTGRTEYTGPQLEAAVARLHRPPRLPASLPADLAAVIRAMTDRDPARRPSAARCAELLRLGDLAPNLDTATMAAALTARHRNTARVLAGLAVISALSGGVVATVQPFGAIPGEPTASIPASAAPAAPATPANLPTPTTVPLPAPSTPGIPVPPVSAATRPPAPAGNPHANNGPNPEPNPAENPHASGPNPERNQEKGREHGRN